MPKGPVGTEGAFWKHSSVISAFRVRRGVHFQFPVSEHIPPNLLNFHWSAFLLVHIFIGPDFHWSRFSIVIGCQKSLQWSSERPKGPENSRAKWFRKEEETTRKDLFIRPFIREHSFICRFVHFLCLFCGQHVSSHSLRERKTSGGRKPDERGGGRFLKKTFRNALEARVGHGRG